MSSNVFYAIKNNTIIASVVLLVPFAYAATQKNTPSVSSSDDTSSVLLASSTIITASIPELSQETGVRLTYGVVEKAKKGMIEKIDPMTNTFRLYTGSSTLLIYNSASTAFYTGKGETIEFEDLDTDMPVYVFGFMRSDNRAIIASKVIVANKSKLLRGH